MSVSVMVASWSLSSEFTLDRLVGGDEGIYV